MTDHPLGNWATADSGWLPEVPDDAYPADAHPLDPPDVIVGEVVDTHPADYTDRDLVPLQLAQGATAAVAAFRDPDAVRDLSRGLQRDLLARLRDMDAAARAARPDGRVTDAVVAQELRLWADAHDTLDAIATAIAAGAKEARVLAGEVVLDVHPDKEHGTSSVRVGAVEGQDVKVSRTQPTEVAADTDALMDVLVASLVAELPDVLAPSARDATPYAAGARDALQKLQTLVSPLKWKSTALDQWGRALEAREEHDLAIRLGHAYGRVARGNPQVKIERPEAKR